MTQRIRNGEIACCSLATAIVYKVYKQQLSAESYMVIGNPKLREKQGLLQSFGRTQSRKLHGRKAELVKSLFPKLRIAIDESRTDRLCLQNIIPNKTEYWLEIGFGGGEHLAEQAKRHPDIGFIGCEPFIDGIAKLLVKIEENKLQNIRILDDDARLILQRLEDNSLDKIFILFPDPWRKTKHHKRRIVNTQTLDMLARVMKPNALLRLATDHENYAEWMLEHLIADGRFKWLANSASDFNTPPKDWIKTRYQQKAERKGHRIYWFDFTLNLSA